MDLFQAEELAGYPRKHQISLNGENVILLIGSMWLTFCESYPIRADFLMSYPWSVVAVDMSALSKNAKYKCKTSVSYA